MPSVGRCRRLRNAGVVALVLTALGPGVGEVSASAQTPAEQGAREVAVLLIKFPGDPAEPWSPDVTRSKVFTAADSANAFYQEESYGQISLTGKLRSDGDVFGWFTLDTPTDGCPYSNWRIAAHQAAAAAGIDLGGYDDIIDVSTHQSACTWNGVSAAAGSWVQINGNLGAKTLTHELGHNMGLLHAGSETCTSGGVRVQISDTCTTNEHGDPFDTQGNIATRHHNGWNLAELGILSAQNIETITADGDYTVKSALNQTTDPTVLRIARQRNLNGQVTSWYYLEIRQTGGIFESPPLASATDASTTGISIRVTASGSSPETLLIDCNPATATFNDAPCAPGESFDDGTVRVTTLSVGDGVATVSVQYPPPPPPPPPPETEPPTAPTNLSADATPSGVQLSWDPSTDNVGVASYAVFRDGAQIGARSNMSFLDRSASSGTHSYVVYAFDAAANGSRASNAASVSVRSSDGPVSPSASGPATGNSGSSRLRLSWRRRHGGRVVFYVLDPDPAGAPRLSLWLDGRLLKSQVSSSLRVGWSPRGERGCARLHRVLAWAQDIDGRLNSRSAHIRLANPPRPSHDCRRGTRSLKSGSRVDLRPDGGA